MTKDEVLKCVADWIEAKDLLGRNCDESYWDDENEVTYDMESDYICGWTYQATLYLPDDWQTLDDEVLKARIKQELRRNLLEWAHDDDDRDQNIEWYVVDRTGSDEISDNIEEIISATQEFKEAQARLLELANEG